MSRSVGFWRDVFVVLLLAVLLVTISACGGGSSSGATPAPGSSGNPQPPSPPAALPPVTLNTFVSGLASPVDMQQPDDGSGRFFVVEQAGTIRMVQNGATAATPFLDIRSKVKFGGEMGLLGLAFHPGFAQDRRFYVNYTRMLGAQLQSVIAEYSASAANPDQADPSSERILIIQNQPFTNHNGGQLAFGPDGFLYIGFGDGGGAGDPHGNGQNVQTLLGKMLRIDVNSTSPPRAYGIPADNPFATGGGLPEIWAYGFRNPWRFSFDVPTGRLFVGDVGQDRFEEIDIATRGGNFGWNVMEASHCFNPATGCDTAGKVLPIAEYDHSEGDAVIGGYVYRGSRIPGLQQVYLMSDFGSGTLWALQENPDGSWKRTQLLATGRGVSALAQDRSGEVYLIDYSGSVLSLDPK